MSSVKALLPKSTSSNKRWKWLRWNEVSAKGDLKQPRLTGTFAASVLVKQEHGTSKTKCKGMYSAKHDDDTVVDVDVHSDEEHGVTSLGSPGHHLTQLPL